LTRREGSSGTRIKEPAAVVGFRRQHDASPQLQQLVQCESDKTLALLRVISPSCGVGNEGFPDGHSRVDISKSRPTCLNSLPSGPSYSFALTPFPHKRTRGKERQVVCGRKGLPGKAGSQGESEARVGRWVGACGQRGPGRLVGDGGAASRGGQLPLGTGPGEWSLANQISLLPAEQCRFNPSVHRLIQGRIPSVLLVLVLLLLLLLQTTPIDFDVFLTVRHCGGVGVGVPYLPSLFICRTSSFPSAAQPNSCELRRGGT